MGMIVSPYRHGVYVPSTPFADDFNDNAIDPVKWTSSATADMAVAESGGQLRISCDSSFGGSSGETGLISLPSMDFTGKQVEMDMVTLDTKTASGIQLRIQSAAVPNNYAAIIVEATTMYFRRSNNGTNSQTTLAWSATYTKWRITHRSSDNCWLFYTHTSGVWTLRFTSAAANWNPTSVKVCILGYIYGSGGNNRLDIVDNIVSDALY